MEKDYSELDAAGVDLIKNGRIQKFEYTTELVWKTSKLFLESKLGIISNSPKDVYRTMFQNNLIDDKLFQDLLKAIDDRNQVSHIYREETYDIIYKTLPGHLNSLQKLLNIITV
ncbi:MAG: nucleotidyltransferase substrate binding protein [Bacteroidetes bacterium]|nr:nucleotidyltransferase substrate binding protein [Bacteroidota bacterium]